jgi:hypothetical protein
LFSVTWGNYRNHIILGIIYQLLEDYLSVNWGLFAQCCGIIFCPCLSYFGGHVWPCIVRVKKLPMDVGVDVHECYGKIMLALQVTINFLAIFPECDRTWCFGICSCRPWFCCRKFGRSFAEFWSWGDPKQTQNGTILASQELINKWYISSKITDQ